MKKLFVGMLSILLFVVTAAGLSTAALAKTVAIDRTYATYTEKDFSVQDAVNPKQLEGVVMTGDLAQGVGAVYPERLSGAYTVEIDLVTSMEPGAGTFGYLTFGNKSTTALGGNITAATDLLSLQLTSGSFIISGPNSETVKIYNSDGTTEAAPNFMANELGWLEHTVTFRFEVTAEANINVYASRTREDGYATIGKLLCIVKGATAEMLDGYFGVTPHFKDADLGINALTVTKSGEAATKVDLSSLTIVGDAKNARRAPHLHMADRENAVITSNFRLDSSDLADGETLFDLTWTQRGLKTAGTASTWGVMLGQKTRESTMATQGVSYFDVSAAATVVYTMGETGAAQADFTGGANATNVYMANASVWFRLVGKKGGTLEVYRQYAGGGATESLTTPHQTYTGLDLDGYLSFYNLTSGTPSATESVIFYDVKLKGVARLQINSVEIDETPFTNVVVGDELTLTAAVDSMPSQETYSMAYEVTEGTELASIEGNVLTVTGGGDITVKGWCVDDPSVYDTVTFTSRELVYGTYSHQEKFFTENTAEFTTRDGDGNVMYVDGQGLSIIGDFKTDTNGSAAVVTKQKFDTASSKNTVFDVTFTSALDTGITQYRSNTYSWGMAFGMADASSKVGDAGVGYFRVRAGQIDAIGTEADTAIYLGTTKVNPTTYHTTRVSEALDVFPDRNPIKVRLVGKSDGTLELYRGYSFYESADTLFATYAGLNLNGHIAFTTDSEKAPTGSVNAGSPILEDYPILFSNISLEGTVLAEGDCTVSRLEIDETVFANAMTGDELTLKAAVSVTPNIDVYSAVEWTVTGGATVIGDKLTVTGKGDITVTATSKFDGTVTDSCTFTADELAVTSVSILNNIQTANIHGNPVTLKHEITTNSSKPAHNAVVWSVHSGTATLNGSVVTFNTVGTVTLRCTSVADPTVYDELTVEVIDRAITYERYRNNDKFNDINECDWALSDTDGNVSAIGGLYFDNDYRSEVGGSAKLSTQVPFVKRADTANVFDITFTSGLLGTQSRDGSYSWGLTFGMPSRTAAVGDTNVGYFKIDFNNTGVYLGTQKIEPTYHTDRVGEFGDVYFESGFDLTVRLVGKNDGTLDVYRGYSIYEKIDTLFATYAGLNFEGYAALTTDSSAVEGKNYSVGFSKLSIEGNTAVDGVFEVKDLTINAAVFRDAIKGDRFTLDATVNTLPNLSAYRAVTWTVDEGPATIEDGILTVTAAGTVKLTAKSASDPSVKQTYSFPAIDFQVTSVTLPEGIFNGVTNDTQPIQLKAVLTCNSIATKHQQVKWEVVSGPAQIALGQLRITGIGKITVRVTSVYDPSFSQEFTFDAVNADGGQKVVDPNASNAWQIFAIVAIVVVIVGAAAVTVVLVLKKKRSK